MAKHFITACWLPGIRSDPPPFGGAPCMLSCDIFLQLFFPGSLTTSHRCQWWIQKTWCDSSISVVAGSWATSPSPVVTLRRQLRGSRSRESGGHVSFTEHLGRCDLNRSQISTDLNRSQSFFLVRYCWWIKMTCCQSTSKYLPSEL